MKYRLREIAFLHIMRPTSGPLSALKVWEILLPLFRSPTMEFPGSECRSGSANESGFALVARTSSLTPEVSRPEEVSSPEATTMVFRSHTRSSAMLSKVNIQPQLVVTVEIHSSDIPGRADNESHFMIHDPRDPSVN